MAENKPKKEPKKRTEQTPKKERPRSPVNGQPLPQGKVIKAGDEARELGQKGGIKSGESRRARKTLREELLQLLTQDITAKDGRQMKTQTAISASMIKQALAGSTKAYEIIRDTIGEKPIDKVVVAEVDPETISEVERLVLGDQEGEEKDNAADERKGD